jgi:acetylornithine deacetylase/succinyl-diaminopimelate desuccinylase-like protein
MPPHGFEAAQWGAICSEATEVLQQLLRIDTSNPPGNERPAAEALAEILAADGLPAEILESAPGRANLICRLPAGQAATEPPLLLSGHLDVVPAGDADRWRHPPFAGQLVDGWIWGRGAVDMKHMVAMCAMVLKLLARLGRPLRRDLILAAVADEEQGCTHGSRFLVERHPEKVRAGFALGETGGFPQRVGKSTVVPVQVAEKGLAWLRLTARGPAGHGSIPRRETAVGKLSRALERLHRRLPQHRTQVVDAFVRSLAGQQPLPQRWAMLQLLNPRLSGLILDRAVGGNEADLLHTLLRNTAVPTVIRAGSKTNVIPDTATAEIDGRTLPGFGARDLVAEVRALVGDEVEIEVIRESAGAVNDPPDSPLWQCIREVVAEHVDLPVVPSVIPGFTDGHQFSRLGTRWYGFSPLWIDPAGEVRFSELVHGYDERIPERGYHWGLELLWDLVGRFCLARR